MARQFGARSPKVNVHHSQNIPHNLTFRVEHSLTYSHFLDSTYVADMGGNELEDTAPAQYPYAWFPDPDSDVPVKDFLAKVRHNLHYRHTRALNILFIFSTSRLWCRMMVRSR